MNHCLIFSTEIMGTHSDKGTTDRGPHGTERIALRKRILFVDDEPVFLELFKAMFAPMADEWEIFVAADAEAALALMERHPFTVVVSDMRMPGMDGAQFLTEVMRRHPKTARIILSGYADQDEVAQSIGAAHQFLSKPCDLMTLQSTLTRVCALDVFLRAEPLKELVSRMSVVPSIPAVYFRVLKELQSPSATAQSIGEIVAQDPGMTAKLLQMVNSAFFGISRKIANVSEAVQMLGINTVRSLGLTIHAFSCFEQSQVRSFSIGRIWNHSVATGQIAKQIAGMARMGAPISDEAFIAGLLHDLGKLMLCANMVSQYQQAMALVETDNLAIWEAEQRVFGATHADVGAYLLGLWGLPAPVVEAVALHHQPRRAVMRTFCPLTAVHVADVLAHERAGESEAGVAGALNSEYLTELDVENLVPYWRTKISGNSLAAAA